jgi:hypothetical protein
METNARLTSVHKKIADYTAGLVSLLAYGRSATFIGSSVGGVDPFLFYAVRGGGAVTVSMRGYDIADVRTEWCRVRTRLHGTSSDVILSPFDDGTGNDTAAIPTIIRLYGGRYSSMLGGYVVAKDNVRPIHLAISAVNSGLIASPPQFIGKRQRLAWLQTVKRITSS